jgi:hypothetical protein
VAPTADASVTNAAIASRPAAFMMDDARNSNPAVLAPSRHPLASGSVTVPYRLYGHPKMAAFGCMYAHGGGAASGPEDRGRMPEDRKSWMPAFELILSSVQRPLSSGKILT